MKLIQAPSPGIAKALAGFRPMAPVMTYSAGGTAIALAKAAIAPVDFAESDYGRGLR